MNVFIITLTGFPQYQGEKTVGDKKICRGRSSVIKTCDALREEGFLSLSTMECLRRELQIRSINLPVLSLTKVLLRIS